MRNPFRRETDPRDTDSNDPAAQAIGMGYGDRYLGHWPPLSSATCPEDEFTVADQMELAIKLSEFRQELLRKAGLVEQPVWIPEQW